MIGSRSKHVAIHGDTCSSCTHHTRFPSGSELYFCFFAAGDRRQADRRALNRAFRTGNMRPRTFTAA